MTLGGDKHRPDTDGVSLLITINRYLSKFIVATTRSRSMLCLARGQDAAVSIPMSVVNLSLTCRDDAVKEVGLRVSLRGGFSG